ncbi:MAG: amidase family protein, partial [Lentisphaeria bacterium]|nr:amidase family protein [Lentisphaeria bacterium]
MDANKPGWDLMSWSRFVFGICAFTPLFNATGHPGVSLPLAMSSGGLPIGVQLMGDSLCEKNILRAGHWLMESGKS